MPPSVTMEQVGQQAAAVAGAFAAGTARVAHHAADRLRDTAQRHAVIGSGGVAYDEHIIEGYAAIMYRRAFWTVVISTVIGLAIGFVIGSVFGAAIALRAGMGGGNEDGAVLPIILGLMIGGAWGYWNGVQKAFWLKLAAQVALCQVQIERNTRT